MAVTTDDLTTRRAWFEAHLPKRRGKRRYVCYCCGYPTLDERAGWDICPICWWEDNGSDDPSNKSTGAVTLSRARENFADHLTMYERGQDTRIGGEDGPEILKAKRALISAFEALRSTSKPTSLPSLWKVSVAREKHLEKLHHQRVKEYERAQRRNKAKR